jgi:hypothetical protein
MGAGGGGAGPVTLTLQPDATAGVDVQIDSSGPTKNMGINTQLQAGEYNVVAAIMRSLIKFDLSSIPAGSTVQSASLFLWAEFDFSDNARTCRVYRQKRAWLEGTRSNVVDSPATGATWIRYDLTNNWQTAGGFGADDCEQTDCGSRDFTATETLGEMKEFVLTPALIQEMIPGGSWTNNGFLIKMDTENNDLYGFVSSDSATAGQRPKLVIVYTAP